MPHSEAQAYPVVYLYRHYLELELKSAVALHCVASTIEEKQNDARKRVEAILNTHDLIKLCGVCRDACISGGMFRDDFIETFGAFENCVKEMASHDPGSFAFRYPIDKKLNQNLTQLRGVDLQHLKIMFDKIGLFLGMIRHTIQRRLDRVETPFEWGKDDELRHLKDVRGIDENEALMESEDSQ